MIFSSIHHSYKSQDLTWLLQFFSIGFLLQLDLSDKKLLNSKIPINAELLVIFHNDGCSLRYRLGHI